MGNSLGHFANPLRFLAAQQLSRPLPTDVLLDIFCCLTRFDLDDVQFPSPQMRDFLDAHAARLPLRDIAEAAIAGRAAGNVVPFYAKGTIVEAKNGLQQRVCSSKTTKEKVCLVMNAIQGAFVGLLVFGPHGYDPFNIDEDDLAMVVAKARNVYVEDLSVDCEGLNHCASTVLAEITAAFRRTGFVWCCSAYPSRVYADIGRRNLAKGVPFPDLETYGCNCPTANTGILGYGISNLWRSGPLAEGHTSKYHVLAADLAEKMYRCECVVETIFYRVRDVPMKQQGLEKYEKNRLPFSTDDHRSYFFDDTIQFIRRKDSIRLAMRFKAQICLHHGCLTFRFTSDPSKCDGFLVCERK